MVLVYCTIINQHKWTNAPYNVARYSKMFPLVSLVIQDIDELQRACSKVNIRWEMWVLLVSEVVKWWLRRGSMWWWSEPTDRMTNCSFDKNSLTWLTNRVRLRSATTISWWWCGRFTMIGMIRKPVRPDIQSLLVCLRRCSSHIVLSIMKLHSKPHAL